MLKSNVTLKVARQVGNKLRVNWDKTNLHQFAKGLKVELEHRDVTKGNLLMTGKIALAHLKEFPDYYTRLKKMESVRRK